MQYSPEQYRAWGAEGGKKRAKRLSKSRRSKIARKAAKARWAKRNGNGDKQEG